MLSFDPPELPQRRRRNRPACATKLAPAKPLQAGANSPDDPTAARPLGSDPSPCPAPVDVGHDPKIGKGGHHTGQRGSADHHGYGRNRTAFPARQTGVPQRAPSPVTPANRCYGMPMGRVC